MERICREKHIRIDEQIKTNQDRLNNHSARLKTVEESSAKMNERLSGLITQLGTLNTTLKWFLGLFGTSLVGFFMYAAQKGLIG